MTRYVYRFPCKRLSKNPLHISVRFVLKNVLALETSAQVAGDIDALTSTIRPTLRVRLVGTSPLATKEYTHAKNILA